MRNAPSRARDGTTDGCRSSAASVHTSTGGIVGARNCKVRGPSFAGRKLSRSSACWRGSAKRAGSAKCRAAVTTEKVPLQQRPSREDSNHCPTPRTRAASAEVLSPCSCRREEAWSMRSWNLSLVDERGAVMTVPSVAIAEKSCIFPRKGNVLLGVMRFAAERTSPCISAAIHRALCEAAIARVMAMMVESS